MTILNRLASNWSRIERERLNTNWSIIENYLSNLQEQIRLLTGGVDVQELINQINDILNQGNVIIGDLETALQDVSTVIANAQNATTDANNAAQDALNAINDMQAFINQFGNAETYDNGKLYKINNIVEFDGSGFICVQDSQGNTPPTLPTKRNDWWQLIAQRGVDGTGSVSRVAGKSPELDGNIPLSPEDIGAVSSNDFNKYLSENTNGINGLFLTKLLDGEITKIKLIGDSITVGNGARNYIQSPIGNRVIFNNGTESYREPAYTTTCYANMFRNFISSNFSDIDFINGAIGGKSVKFANENKTYWITNSEDIVFVMLGTNDRWDCATPSEFRTNLISFLEYVNSRCNMMIVMTAPPTLNDNDSNTYNFGMREVDQVITEVCQKNNYTHLSLFRGLLNFSERSGATLKTLIEKDGSHPINEGYDALWKLIQERFGFIDNTENWKNSNTSSLYNVLIGAQVPYILSTTPIQFFEQGKRTVIELESYSDLINFPEQTQGWLTTSRGFSNDLFSYQLYEPRESYNTYKRIWNYSSDNWSDWRRLNDSKEVQNKTIIPITPGNIAANTVVNIEVLYTSINSSYFPFITVTGTIPNGVITAPHLDYSTNRVYLRVYNATSNSVTVGELKIVCVQLF